MLVIGSTAIKHHFPDFGRESKDYDMFARPEEVDSSIDSFWDHRLSGTVLDRTGYATPNELYTIKISHSFWEIPNSPKGNWEKHLHDAMFLKSKGARLNMDLYRFLYQIWTDRYGSKKMDLTKEADSFFKDAVHRIYDHDSIHYSVAYEPGKPLYERILKDGHSVDIDPQKMWGMPFEDQVKLFREEVYATALERILIPKNYQHSPRAAYAWALRRTVTSLTKGRSARFIAENFDIFQRPDVNYLQKHLDNAHFLIPLEKENVV